MLEYEASRAPFGMACVIIGLVVLVSTNVVPEIRETFRSTSKSTRHDKGEKALFTEEYYKEMPQKYKHTEQEAANGWVFDDQRWLKSKVSPDGRTLKTWEIIRENGKVVP